MPAYNASRYIATAIDSVLAQTYNKPIELIVVDDGSTDDTWQIMQAYAAKSATHKTLRLLQHTHNIGTYAARNTAIRCSRGRYLAFLDADDIWLPNKLEIQMAHMQTKHIAFSYTDYEKVNAQGQYKKTITCKNSYNYDELLMHCGIGNSTVILDRQRIPTDINLPTNKYREDYLLWLKILNNQQSKAIRCPHVLSTYRVHRQSQSHNKFKMLHANYKIYRQDIQCSRYQSINLIGKYIYKKMQLSGLPSS